MLINELLGIKYPIFQGAMANIATPEFAAAVSNCGALGIIATGAMDEHQTREAIRTCKQLTDQPFVVNVMLMNPCLLYTSGFVRPMIPKSLKCPLAQSFGQPATAALI